jgi:SPP1 family predicted phage head-tail adaptor
MPKYRASTIGDLRTRVTLQSPTIARDAGGAQSPSWASEGDVWAAWKNAHGPESIADDAKQSLHRATVVIRYRNDVTTRWAVVKNGQRFSILSVDHIQERGAYLELQVQAMEGTV